MKRVDSVDDYSRVTQPLFLTPKEQIFKKFIKFVQNLYNLKNVTLWSDYGGEFVNY